LLTLASLVRRIDSPGLTTTYKLLPPGRWSHPSKLDALRSQLTSKRKRDAASTSAPDSPVRQVRPRRCCTPTGAPDAPKGSPSEGTPKTSSEPPAQKKPRAHKSASALSRLSE